MEDWWEGDLREGVEGEWEVEFRTTLLSIRPEWIARHAAARTTYPGGGVGTQ